MSVYQLSARELYDAYVPGQEPAEVLAQGREAIAQRLRVEEGLDQREAYYAADQILVAAQRRQAGEGPPE
jgi:hypothetical protein